MASSGTDIMLCLTRRCFLEINATNGTSIVYLSQREDVFSCSHGVDWYRHRAVLNRNMTNGTGVVCHLQREDVFIVVRALCDTDIVLCSTRRCFLEIKETNDTGIV